MGLGVGGNDVLNIVCPIAPQLHEGVVSKQFGFSLFSVVAKTFSIKTLLFVSGSPQTFFVQMRR